MSNEPSDTSNNKTVPKKWQVDEIKIVSQRLQSHTPPPSPTPDIEDSEDIVPFWMYGKVVSQPLYVLIEDKIYNKALPLSCEDARLLSSHYFYKMHHLPFQDIAPKKTEVNCRMEHQLAERYSVFAQQAAQQAHELPDFFPRDETLAAFEDFEAQIKHLADKILTYYMKKSVQQSLFEMPSMRYYRQRKQQLLELALKKYFSIQGKDDFNQQHWDNLYQFFKQQFDQQRFSLNEIRDVMNIHHYYSEYLQETHGLSHVY